MKWHAYFSAPAAYVTMLPTAIRSPVLTVRLGDGGKPYWESSLLDKYEQYEVARTASGPIMETLNGLITLIWPGFAPKCLLVEIAGLSEGREPIRALCGAPRLQITVAGDVEGVHELILDQEGLPFPGNLKTTIAAQLGDDIVRDVLRVYGLSMDPDWVSLYKVVELIERDMGGRRQLEQSGLISRNEAELFRRSANSWLASGLVARHATVSHEPPLRPMSLPEARTRVRQLMSQWLASRHSPS